MGPRLAVPRAHRSPPGLPDAGRDKTVDVPSRQVEVRERTGLKHEPRGAFDSLSTQTRAR